MQREREEAVPVFLLKTRSTPQDGYEDCLLSSNGTARFQPIFMPVLEHRLRADGLSHARDLLARVNEKDTSKPLGGLIFTSQRAVEAFRTILEELHSQHVFPDLSNIPVYTVGPATTRALRAIPTLATTEILGEETGNGEALANFILDHYNTKYSGTAEKPQLVFFVGEQRRDIIPSTLMTADLPVDQRIDVLEIVVYETGVMESFESDFGAALKRTEHAPLRWVVVFSPTGCESMLNALDLLDKSTCRLASKLGPRRTFVATIGPTTRDYLKSTFDFEPDICATQPSPEAIEASIRAFVPTTDAK